MLLSNHILWKLWHRNGVPAYSAVDARSLDKLHIIELPQCGGVARAVEGGIKKPRFLVIKTVKKPQNSEF